MSTGQGALSGHDLLLIIIATTMGTCSILNITS